jgi:hypothetical protein
MKAITTPIGHWPFNQADLSFLKERGRAVQPIMAGFVKPKFFNQLIGEKREKEDPG